AASHAARNDGRLSPRAHLAHRRSGARRGERATSDRNAVKATHLAGDPPTALFPNWEAVVLPLIRIEAEDLVGDIVQLDPHRQLLSALEVRYFGTAHDEGFDASVERNLLGVPPFVDEPAHVEVRLLLPRAGRSAEIVAELERGSPR